MILQIKEFFFIGIYLKDTMELDGKTKIICDILNKIYDKSNEPKILLAGDFNIKPSENNSNGELEALEELLVDFNVTIKSDRDKITCYNHNGRGTSTHDYVVTSHNFTVIENLNYIQMHAGSDHVAFRMSFRLPRHIFNERETQTYSEVKAF